MKLLRFCAILIGLFIISNLHSQEILINQVGYELTGSKIAVIQSTDISDFFTDYTVLDENDEPVYAGTIEYAGAVPGWTGRYFHTIDFSNFQEEGIFKIQVDGINSYNFQIKTNVLFTETAYSIISFFNQMRHPANKDTDLPFHGTRSGTVDLHGGWFDATGDPGKHMSHLSYGNFTNPQQIPMVAWSMMESLLLNPDGFTDIYPDLLSEIQWGLDYLMRNHDTTGYFYLAIFDNWGGSALREVCEWGQEGSDSERTENFQCAFREGGGVAIAALAKAYTMGIDGVDFTKEDLLSIAESSYAHLKINNLSYCNNGEENIIDDYCALLATIELYKATENTTYLNDANARVTSLLAKQQTEGWFAANASATRPFFHAADEGLPIVSLVNFKKIDNARDAEIDAALSNWLHWYKQITYEDTNPFDYIKEYNSSYNAGLYGDNAARFFLPHDNETGYWWQGENARLASMSTAVIYASKSLSSAFEFGDNENSRLAVTQLDWILGKNPFDLCMMHEFGQNNPPAYLMGNGYSNNIKGGICNGITAMDSDENDLDFMPYDAANWQNWRWVEQWLPHNAWFLMAVSSLSNVINGSSNYVIPPMVEITSPLHGAGFSIGDTISITATAYDATYEISQVEFFAGGISVGIDYDEPYSLQWIPQVGGDITISATATNSEGKSGYGAITVSVDGQGPYGGVLHRIPGDLIEAEDFDTGGEGVAYHDTGGGSGSAVYRPGETVHIENCSAGGYNVGYTANNEWLEYSVYIEKSGAYDFRLSTACWANSDIRLEIDGNDVSGSVTIPAYGSFQDWSDDTIPDITLPQGTHVLRIYFESASMNLNSITTISKIPDCNGEIGGNAYIDNCDKCVGGSTGMSECVAETVRFNKGLTLFSTPLDLVDNDISIVFEAILPNIISIRTLDKTYIPGGVSNTLTTIDAGVGYIVALNTSALLQLNGSPTGLPKNYQLQEGWNLVGMPYTYQKTINSFFSGMLSNLIEVKDYEYFYNVNCANELLKLQSLSDGKAYMVKLNASATLVAD